MKNFNKSADRSLFLRGSRLKMNLKVSLNKIIEIIRHKLTTTIVPRSKILSMTMETTGSISMKPRSNRKRWHNAEGDTHSCAVLHRLFFSFFSLGKNVGQSRAVNDPDRFCPELFTRVSYRIEETAVTRTDRSTISR